VPSYAYRIVHTRNSARAVEDHLAPHAFAGTAAPVPDNLLEIDHYTYYIAARDFDVAADRVLGGSGTDVTHGVPQGLIVAGAGPGLKIRTGHQSGYITLDVRRTAAEPAADRSAWDAIEQATIGPLTRAGIFNDRLEIQEQFPDLAGGRRTEYLAVRVSARGRDTTTARSPAADPRRFPLEQHLVEAWPAAGPAPREIYQRDETTAYWESAALPPPRRP
jgi:hypothetical protein